MAHLSRAEAWWASSPDKLLRCQRALIAAIARKRAASKLVSKEDGLGSVGWVPVPVDAWMLSKVVGELWQAVSFLQLKQALFLS